MELSCQRRMKLKEHAVGKAVISIVTEIGGTLLRQSFLLRCCRIPMVRAMPYGIGTVFP
jgi:hypothetical protein